MDTVAGAPLASSRHEASGRQPASERRAASGRRGSRGAVRGGHRLRSAAATSTSAEADAEPGSDERVARELAGMAAEIGALLRPDPFDNADRAERAPEEDTCKR